MATFIEAKAFAVNLLNNIPMTEDDYEIFVSYLSVTGFSDNLNVIPRWYWNHLVTTIDATYVEALEVVTVTTHLKFAIGA
jgi:hypothetical protein